MKLIDHIHEVRSAEYPDQYIRKLAWDGVIDDDEAKTLRIYLKFKQKLAAEEVRHET